MAYPGFGPGMSLSAARRERQRAVRRARLMKLLVAATTITGYAAVSCSDQGSGASRGESAPRSSARMTSPGARSAPGAPGAVVAGGEVSRTGADSTAPPIRWLSDANLLALFSIMNQRQIAAAQVELEAWHSSQVRGFALSMARDHLAMQREIDSLSQQIDVQPVRPAVADQISAEFQARIDAMAEERWGPRGSLDRAFVQQQVASHQAMAGYLSGMTGSAERPEVRQFLSAAARRVNAQLASARSMQSTLALADSTAADSNLADTAGADPLRALPDAGLRAPGAAGGRSATPMAPDSTLRAPAANGGRSPAADSGLRTPAADEGRTPIPAAPDSMSGASDPVPSAPPIAPPSVDPRPSGPDSTVARPRRPAGDSTRPPGR